MAERVDPASVRVDPTERPTVDPETRPTELPELVGELVDLSKEYLRQETVEPAKQLGRFAGFSLAAGVVFAVVALYLGLATYQGLLAVLPDDEWFVVLARGLTVVVTGAVAGIIAWRMMKR